MTQSEHKHSGAQLTEEERKELRGVMEDHRRAKWLWGSMYRILAAIGAVSAVLVGIKTLLGDYFK